MGRGTAVLVAEARKESAALRKELGAGTKIDVWCVFDRDTSPSEQFNGAIRLAERSGFHVGWSNDAFELWFLLHFDDISAALDRKLYGPMLSRRLGRPYEKRAPDLRGLLKDKEAEAITRATKLASTWTETDSPADRNPCTTVHELVQVLRGLERP